MSISVVGLLLSVAGALPTAKRVVLVTGANKGIGKEIARTLGSLDDHVVILGCRDEALGNAAVAELQALGCDCSCSRLDLRREQQIDARVHRANIRPSRCAGEQRGDMLQ